MNLCTNIFVAFKASVRVMTKSIPYHDCIQRYHYPGDLESIFLGTQEENNIYEENIFKKF